MDLSAAGATGNLVARRLLGEEHRGLEVGLVDFVEGLLRHLHQRLLALDADAVDEHVDAVHRRDHLASGLAHRSDVAGVESVSGRGSAGNGDAGGERIGLRTVPAGDRDTRAVAGEGEGDGLAQCAIPARDEDAQALDVEQAGDPLRIDLWREARWMVVHGATSTPAAR